jgi:hypothetical protein
MCEGLVIVVRFRNKLFEVWSVLEWGKRLNDRGFDLTIVHTGVVSRSPPSCACSSPCGGYPMQLQPREQSIPAYE